MKGWLMGSVVFPTYARPPLDQLPMYKKPSPEAVERAKAARVVADKLRSPICRDDFGPPDALSWAEYESKSQFPLQWDERDAKV